MQFIQRLRLLNSQISERIIDLYYNVKTNDQLSGDSLLYPGTDYHMYLPTSWIRLFMLLGALPIKKTESFLDVGCGKGRALFAAMKYPFHRVIGIERSPELCKIATENLARFSERTNINASRCEIIYTDVLKYEIPIDAKYIFFCCPFGASSSRLFFKGLAEQTPKGMSRYIISVNPAFIGSLSDYFSVEVVKVLQQGMYRIDRIHKR